MRTDKMVSKLKFPLISKAFQAFGEEAPVVSEAWMKLVQQISDVSALDRKTKGLAYLAVLAALRLESGVPFHVQQVKMSGATREEVISAILVGLPAAGHGVTQVLPAALEAYDSE
jgi:alkylhydroperoxidase/carboxymuconolactone decarboxylase family protein YurZ